MAKSISIQRKRKKYRIFVLSYYISFFGPARINTTLNEYFLKKGRFNSNLSKISNNFSKILPPGKSKNGKDKKERMWKKWTSILLKYFFASSKSLNWKIWLSAQTVLFLNILFIFRFKLAIGLWPKVSMPIKKTVWL